MGVKLRSLLVFSLLAAAPTWAQRQTASVAGSVTDASGAPVPSARVNVKNLDTGLSRETVSNDAGYYAITALPAGPYSVAAAKKGSLPPASPSSISRWIRTPQRTLLGRRGGRMISVVGQVTAVDTRGATLNTVINKR